MKSSLARSLHSLRDAAIIHRGLNANRELAAVSGIYKVAQKDSDLKKNQIYFPQTLSPCRQLSLLPLLRRIFSERLCIRD